MAIDWKEVAVRTASYTAAVMRGASRADIEDVASEAIARTLESESPQTTERFVRSTLATARNLARSWRRRRQRGRLVLADVDVADDIDALISVVERLDHERFLAELSSQLRHDRDAQELLLAMREGVATGEQLAQKLGCSLADVRNRRRRLMRRARTLRSSWGGTPPRGVPP